MVKHKQIKSGLRPVHPGEILREDVLPALGRPKQEIARLLGISRAMLYNILDESHAVTPEMAVRLGKLCGNGAEIWLRLQQAYDLARAKAALADEVKKIPNLNKDAA